MSQKSFIERDFTISGKDMKINVPLNDACNNSVDGNRHLKDKSILQLFLSEPDAQRVTWKIVYIFLLVVGTRKR